jgi:ubiquinone/menaquinone biosynthesis C-methylase UbiE
MSNITDPTKRFSNRVENYIKYRPHYPHEIIDYLKTENVLKHDSIIADIGSGTGISSELFLKNGNTVYGVEPNKEMREAGEKYLSGYKNFISVNGKAESTTLNDNSADIVAAGQAFHWFDVEKAKREFKRILKDRRFVVLIWNIRQSNESEFGREYSKLLFEFGTDFKKVRHQTKSKREFDEFFKDKFTVAEFDNEQIFDYKGLKGRLLSSSYIPDKNHPHYAPTLTRLREIFDKHQKNGKVTMKYKTEVSWGEIK